MKRLSVRKKLTLWMTALMLALVIVVLGFLFAVSSRVAMQSAQEQLESFVRGNLTSITMENDTLQFGEGFQFTRSGNVSPGLQCVRCAARRTDPALLPDVGPV